MKLFPDQEKALAAAKENSIFILTGPPGTGKTTTIKSILELFPTLNIKLCGPTGKSSKRITEQTGRPASTIHKLLDPKPGIDNAGKTVFHFTNNHDNPIRADMVIVDECSMITISLMASLLDAISPSTRLIMVGDVYQLPSVGPGNVLKDMIASGRIPYVELDTIKRQDPGNIILSCHAVKNGNNVVFDNGPKSDFFFISKNKSQAVLDEIIELVTNRLPKHYDADPMRDIQVISPLREKSPLACKPINKILQEELNPVPLLEKDKFKVGDKVIQTKNKYELGIVNGDIGYIKEIDKENEKKIVVDFENPTRRVSVDLYHNQLELAYSLTCHKMQGSEAPIIVIPIHECLGSRIPDRPLIYTAISRASKVCVLVGQKKELQAIIARNHNYKRFTGLKGKIVEYEKEFEIKKSLLADNCRISPTYPIGNPNSQKCDERCEGECIDDIYAVCPDYKPDYSKKGRCKWSDIKEALSILSDMCDGAHSINGTGFNKYDTENGKKLANGINSAKDAFRGKMILKKYKRQLPDDLYSRIF